MKAIAQELLFYETESGNQPFSRWFSELRDQKTKAVIDARLTRLRLGNFGVCRAVGRGVLELKIDFGPGFRVYFGRDGNKVLVLPSGRR